MCTLRCSQIVLPSCDFLNALSPVRTAQASSPHALQESSAMWPTCRRECACAQYTQLQRVGTVAFLHVGV